MAATESGSTLPPDGVDFIDENNAWRMTFGLVEQVTHSRCADSDKHLNELTSAYRKEGDSCFSCDCTSHQSFTCAGRSYQEDPFRDASAETLEFLACFQEFYDFSEFLFGFIFTGNIIECRCRFIHGK